MAQKLIANEDCILAPNDSNVICTIARTGTPSAKSKLNNKGIIKDQFEIQISAITYPTAGATIPDPGPYTKTINATATKDKTENCFVCRIGDKTATISATPQIPPVPPAVDPIDFPIQFTIDITNAGQIKALGE